MSSVSCRMLGDIAVLEVNNPPVNALSFQCRKNLLSNLERLLADNHVNAIVLCGKRVFLGGADIKEFATGNQRRCILDNLEKISSDTSVNAIVLSGKDGKFIGGADISEFKDGSFYSYPTITDLTHILENCKKPIVAAIDGFALGGGFEIAISCHYRVANANSVFGFPEVDIGILPAATGTQRFPRLAGLRAAMDLIPTGKRITAQQALRIGAVDKVVSGDTILQASGFAKSIAKKPFDKRKTSKMPIKDVQEAVQLRDAAVSVAQRKSRGMLAPLFCIKSVMAATEHPFEEGLKKETELAMTLFTSGQARALQYAFFAQRAAVKWEVPGVGSYKTTKPLPIRTSAVIGAGTMGSGIAMALLNAGIPVTLVEQNAEFLKKGVAAIKALYAGSVKLGKLKKEQAESILKKLKTAMKFTEIKDVDIVIEAVYENLALKRKIFAELDTICKPQTLLCSNTSSISIDKIASATKRPGKVAGVHFFVPAYYMKLLENVRGTETSPETMATVMELGHRMGKVPVLVGNCTGFVANRMRGPHTQEAMFLVEEGCWPEEVDQVMEDLGLPLGPLKISDLSGLDIGVSIAKEAAKSAGVELTRDTRYIDGNRYCGLVQRLVAEGRLGRKTGKGIYKYEAPNAKVPYSDPDVAEIIRNYCRERNIQRRRISSQEISERMLYSSINEGFKIMEEGMSTKPEDIDTMWLLGFSWPRYLGGPMYYANTVGLKRVYERVCHYYEQHPDVRHWQPSVLLRKLAEKDVPFKDWSKHCTPVGSKL